MPEGRFSPVEVLADKTSGTSGGSSLKGIIAEEDAPFVPFSVVMAFISSSLSLTAFRRIILSLKYNVRTI